jgi:thiamine-phosphate diphosphorylase
MSSEARLRAASTGAVICLVTDRRRLTAATGQADLDWRAALLDQVRGAVAGGIDAIYVRERDLEARVLIALTREIVAICRARCVAVLVSDRVDVALVSGATGVQLPERGIPIAAARRLAPSPFLVGRSVHDAVTAAASRDASHLLAGHVFDTSSKPDRSPIGLDGLAAIVNAASPCPVWAIGGITKENAASAMAVGARGVASIDAFIPRGIRDGIEGAVREATTRLRDR